MEIIKKQGNIFDLTNTDYSLVFGHMGMALVPALEEIGIQQNPFILIQPIEWPNSPNRLTVQMKNYEVPFTIG